MSEGLIFIFGPLYLITFPLYVSCELIYVITGYEFDYQKNKNNKLNDTNLYSFMPFYFFNVVKIGVSAKHSKC